MRGRNRPRKSLPMLVAVLLVSSVGLSGARAQEEESETPESRFLDPGDCVDVEGEFGSLTLTITNAVSENPRTGRLTSMSIVRTIRDATDPFRIGT